MLLLNFENRTLDLERKPIGLAVRGVTAVVQRTEAARREQGPDAPWRAAAGRVAGQTAVGPGGRFFPPCGHSLRGLAAQPLGTSVPLHYRPPVATKRLSVDGRGRVVYRYKQPFRDGSTHVILQPPARSRAVPAGEGEPEPDGKGRGSGRSNGSHRDNGDRDIRIRDILPVSDHGAIYGLALGTAT